MSDIVLSVIPELANMPLFLILVDIVLLCFFGGIIFSKFWCLITGKID